jgi:hypothetical protein
VIRLIRRECRTSLTANRAYWRVRPMSVSVTLNLAREAHHGRSIQDWGSPTAITDGGGMADMQRVSNRRVLSNLITQVAALRQAECSVSSHPRSSTANQRPLLPN